MEDIQYISFLNPQTFKFITPLKVSHLLHWNITFFKKNLLCYKFGSCIREYSGRKISTYYCGTGEHEYWFIVFPKSSSPLVLQSQPPWCARPTGATISMQVLANNFWHAAFQLRLQHKAIIAGGDFPCRKKIALKNKESHYRVTGGFHIPVSLPLSSKLSQEQHITGGILHHLLHATTSTSAMPYQKNVIHGLTYNKGLDLTQRLGSINILKPSGFFLYHKV